MFSAGRRSFLKSLRFLVALPILVVERCKLIAGHWFYSGGMDPMTLSNHLIRAHHCPPMMVQGKSQPQLVRIHDICHDSNPMGHSPPPPRWLLSQMMPRPRQPMAWAPSGRIQVAPIIREMPYGAAPARPVVTVYPPRTYWPR